jgi:hypothetical protein
MDGRCWSRTRRGQEVGAAGLYDRQDRFGVLAELSFRDLVPAIWLPTAELRTEHERSRWRLRLVKHRSILKNRVHLSLTAFWHQVPMADLFGIAGRRLLRAATIFLSRGAVTSRRVLS